MQAKLSAEELGEAFDQVAYGCREPEVEHLGRILDHIEALERELTAARSLLLEHRRKENGCDRTVCTDAQGPNCVCTRELNERLSANSGDG